MTPRSPSASEQRRGVPTGLLTAVFGLILVAAAWMDNLQRTAAYRAAEIERIHRENDALVRAFEEHVRHVLQTADGLLQSLKEEFEKQGRVTEGMAEMVRRAKGDPSSNQIAVADARGDLVLSAVPLASPVNISQNETFRAHVTDADAGLYIAAPIRTQVSGAWSFFLARRVNRPRRPL